jgi:hypothetical protein
MNRRDFLTFRVERRLRVAELSCERLYMLLLDVQLTGESHNGGDISSWNGGEPPAVYERRSAEDVFEQIDRDLTEVDVLRITGTEWLTSDAPARHLERVIAAFRARGGRVEGRL